MEVLVLKDLQDTSLFSGEDWEILAFPACSCSTHSGALVRGEPEQEIRMVFANLGLYLYLRGGTNPST